MKKSIAVVATGLLLFSLTSCNNDPSVSEVTSEQTPTSNESTPSTSNPTTSEGIPANKITYSDATKLLDHALVDEALKSNKAHVVNTVTSSSLQDIKEENFEIFSDRTSASKGTVKFLEDGTLSRETTFNTRNTRKIDKIKSEDKVYEYDMFVTATDYEDDDFGRYLKDDASRIFIVGSDAQAQQGGLVEGQYILADAYPIYSSRHLCKDVKDFMLTNIIANPSLGSLGTPLMTISTEGNNWVYEGDISYSYQGDLNDTITERIATKFILDAKKDRLLSAELIASKEDVNNADKEDKYVSSTKLEASLSYEERQAVASDVIDVDDYFLSDVSEVQLLQSKNGYKEVLPSQVTLDGTYLRAKAKTYTPSKAIDVDLHCIASSNPEVLKVEEDGLIEVLTKGTSTLTFQYGGKEGDTFVLKQIEVPVTVVDSVVEEVSILYNDDVLEGCMNEGETVTFRTSISPSKANQAVTATTDHADILEVSVDETNRVIVKGLKAGKAKLIVKSVQDPTKTVEKDIEVLSKDLDFKSIITSKTYETKSLYTYAVYTLNFKADGTGTLVVKPVEGEAVTFTFSYTVERNRITFTEWSENTDISLSFQTGTIAGSDAHLIHCYVEWENVEEGGISLNIMNFNIKKGN